MTRGLLVPLLAMPVLLLLSCGGDEAAPPPSPVATAPTEATPTPAPPSPTEAATATPVPTATATPSPSPTATPTPEPTPPPVTVAGPLVVFSEIVAERNSPPHGRRETRRVYVYDVGADRYWVAFDYPHAVLRSGVERSAVKVAGGSLIVWSEDEVLRVSLAGETERVLFDSGRISWLEPSPDGTKVAIMYGPSPSVPDAGVLVVDIASGREVLDTGGRFDPISIRSASENLRQRWHADGTALLVEEQGRPGLLRLDGTFEVLPEDWHVSLDLRYALRVGEEAGGVSFNRHHYQAVWESLDVLDVATGDVLWTVQAPEDGGLFQEIDYAGDGWWGPGLPKAPAWDDRRHLFFNELTPEPGLPNRHVLRVLDVASGEVRPFTDEVEARLRGPVGSDCRPRSSADPSRRSYLRAICYDGEVIWEGASRWLQFLGVVEPAGDIELRGVVPLRVAVEPDPPPPPPREEMVGPLLLYEVYRPHPTAPRLAIAYDEATGHSWTLYRREHSSSCAPPQAAQGGFVTCAWAEPLYVPVDGQPVPLDNRAQDFRVSPDGRMVAYSSRYNPHSTVVFEVPSGDEVLRVIHDEIPTIAGLPPAMTTWTVWGEEWTSDSSAVVLEVVDDDMGYGGPTVAVIARLDGTLHLVPCEVSDYSRAPKCYAPDGRHVVRGRSEVSGEYIESDFYNWRYLDFIASETEEILWSVDAPGFLSRWDWEWASPDHFAWSHDLLHRRFPERFAATASRAAVSVFDIRTGETETLDFQDYLARFHSSRATTDCPENPAHSCRILLDGEVVGEGRWPTIIGIVELDPDTP